MRVGRSYITLDLKLLHYYCMENVDLNKVLLVTCIGPQCLWVHVWNMWHDWGTPWKIGSSTMLGYKNHKDVAITINVWVDANFVNFLSFGQ